MSWYNTIFNRTHYYWYYCCCCYHIIIFIMRLRGWLCAQLLQQLYTTCDEWEKMPRDRRRNDMRKQYERIPWNNNLSNVLATRASEQNATVRTVLKCRRLLTFFCSLRLRKRRKHSNISNSKYYVMLYTYIFEVTIGTWNICIPGDMDLCNFQKTILEVYWKRRIKIDKMGNVIENQ